LKVEILVLPCGQLNAPSPSGRNLVNLNNYFAEGESYLQDLYDFARRRRAGEQKNQKNLLSEAKRSIKTQFPP
jgi:hypothetical protein